MNRVYPLDNLESKLEKQLVTPSTGDTPPSLMYEVLKYSPPNEALLFLQDKAGRRRCLPFLPLRKLRQRFAV